MQCLYVEKLFNLLKQAREPLKVMEKYTLLMMLLIYEFKAIPINVSAGLSIECKKSTSNSFGRIQKPGMYESLEKK